MLWCVGFWNEKCFQVATFCKLLGNFNFCTQVIPFPINPNQVFIISITTWASKGELSGLVVLCISFSYSASQLCIMFSHYCWVQSKGSCCLWYCFELPVNGRSPVERVGQDGNSEQGTRCPTRFQQKHSVGLWQAVRQHTSRGTPSHYSKKQK
jgi:hypothetical protein